MSPLQYRIIISSISQRIFFEHHSFCPDTHTQITMWTKPIAALLICIAQGAAANLFDGDEERVVVHADAEAPTHSHSAHSYLFDDAGPVVEESERYTCRSIVAIAYAPQPMRKVDNATEQGQRNLRKKKKHAADNNMEVEDHQEEGFACEVEDGQDVPIEATPAQLEEMRSALLNGTLISAVSTMEVDMFDIAEEEDTNDVGSSEITPPSSSSSSRGKSAKLPPGPIHLSTDSRRLAEHPQRRLNKLTGTKKLLVVRITDSEGLAPAGNAAFYSDKFFGTKEDLETPKAQLNGCSHGGESKSVMLLFGLLFGMIVCSHLHTYTFCDVLFFSYLQLWI